jgi:hypothetical protein
LNEKAYAYNLEDLGYVEMITELDGLSLGLALVD